MILVKESLLIVWIIGFILVPVISEDVSYQACVDKYSRKGYQPWQEWSDHYTCHRYRCEIRDGKYFIAAVGCRKPKIPENALECHEYIEDENVEFPTCCARLRCVVESNGERIVQTRGQPGELFPDKPWKGQANEASQAAAGQATALGGGETMAQTSNAQQQPGMFPGRSSADGGDINGRRYVDPFPNQQISGSPRNKRSAGKPIFDRTTITDQMQAMNVYGVSQGNSKVKSDWFIPSQSSLVFNPPVINKNEAISDTGPLRNAY